MIDPAQTSHSSVVVPQQDLPVVGSGSNSSNTMTSPLSVSPLIQSSSSGTNQNDEVSDSAFSSNKPSLSNQSTLDDLGNAPNDLGSLVDEETSSTTAKTEPNLLVGNTDIDLEELSNQGLIQVSEVKYNSETDSQSAGITSGSVNPSISTDQDESISSEIIEHPPKFASESSIESTSDESVVVEQTVGTSEEVNNVEESSKETQDVDQTFQTGVASRPKIVAQSVLDVLTNNGAIDSNLASQILTTSVQRGINVDIVLNDWPDIREDDLAQARAEFYKIPYVNLSSIGVFPEALSKVPENIARHYRVLPFATNKEDKTLSVAMNNPLDVTAIDFLQQKTGFRVLPHYASPSEIDRLIGEQYAQNLSSEVDKAVEQNLMAKEQRNLQKDFSELSSGGTIRQAPITKIVQTILALALKARASDIHIEPQENRTRVRYRIDGILQERLILPQTVHGAVVSRIKILSGLKIDERRLPQDGRFDFSDRGQEIDLRVSTLPTIHGEKVVMRLLQKNSQVPSLPDLGLNSLALRHVEDSIKVPHGIILITGPTGSGKTTTLYSLLHTINTPRVNIVTLEDPVEYMMLGVNQVQINPQAGLTFASGLRSFLRQDPNVIMVGEIRDSETAGLAIQASLTGHLVFSTLHTSSAATAIPRLMDMDAEPFLLASSMTCVIAQRIARVLHPDYKESYKPEPSVLEDIKKVLGIHFDRWLAKKNLKESDVVLYRPTKDRPETEPEYLGRIAIFEVMLVTEEIGKLILARKPASDLENLAIEDGMLLMKQDGYIKALEGITTIEEVLRVAEI